ncbi:hypothetical protein NDK43_30825 [Neobacillus pocheonensis]|uniref:Uncharacterized protein n=1 Tax=Neobacillus pocheonensis TaxID=363869 RepID=A0ABT0WIH7_9BACI|nr:hypothetical protein [Neobacillus pocheonensis]
MSLKSPMKDKILQVERKIVLEKPNEGQNPPGGEKIVLEKPNEGQNPPGGAKYCP